MPSYPIRPTFPIDVRSTPTIAATREGTSFRFDIVPGSLGDLPGPDRAQFFAALEAFIPGATSTLAAAVPADRSDPVYRAFNDTTFVTPAGALVVFAKNTLGLTDPQMTAILAQAATLTN
ncbi:hypothetical protein ASF41_22900 [Methylobacterium sp. Leaf111]|uniref:hypothetical protein n=1 Tax=Methylobacterium sp. Leaf111 TaxID=1736257 RepID=UPI0006FD44CB|nr:hypothetical protein [Methylobacterium sp. Leaf111]KQP61121.1 hypothetical protein ASF41_22900 [Methylobacterium sp. Leaf111]